jgi:hypothetical protein
MRKLIARAFSISLDGVSADYGTKYFEWCMSGIDPRVHEVASQYHLAADDSQLDPTGNCTGARTRSSWGGTPTRACARISLRAAPRQTTRGPTCSTQRARSCSPARYIR